MRTRRRSAIRAVASLAVVAATAVLAASCGSSSALPDGYVAGPVSDVPACCAAGDYLPLPGVDCPSSSCDGGLAYAVCSDGAFAGCTCTMPTEGKMVEATLCDAGALLDAPGFGMDAGCFLDSGEAVPCGERRPDASSDGYAPGALEAGSKDVVAEDGATRDAAAKDAEPRDATRDRMTRDVARETGD